MVGDRGYVRYTPYHGVELTETGQAMATELVRRHRLLELFLVQIMGFPLDEVDAEAERLEHALSDAFVERMETLLGASYRGPPWGPHPRRAGQGRYSSQGVSRSRRFARRAGHRAAGA